MPSPLNELYVYIVLAWEVLAWEMGIKSLTLALLYPILSLYAIKQSDIHAVTLCIGFTSHVYHHMIMIDILKVIIKVIYNGK